MSIPPPNDPNEPTRPLPPAQPAPVAVPPAPRAVERERVVEQVVEPEFDPRFALAQLDDRQRSLRTAVVMLGLVSLAALLLGGYALLRAEDADRSDRDSGSRAAVSRLQDRIDELESDVRDRQAVDPGSVEKALADKADAKDVAALEKALADVQDAAAKPAEPAEAQPDPETTQAINDLTTRLDDLEQRVEEAEQQAPSRTSAVSSLPCRRSRPRWTAAMNFERLTSSVLRISSA
jgi:chromosome segregation ATPase